MDRYAKRNDRIGQSLSLSLSIAQKRPMDAALLEEQFGRLGGTIYQLDKLEVEFAR